MRLEEFLQALARTRRDWRLTHGKIRCGPSACPDCPLTAVAEQLNRPSASPLARPEPQASTLSLAPELVMKIIAASDNLDQADPLLRMELLEASGLLIQRRDRESAFSARAPQGI